VAVPSILAVPSAMNGAACLVIGDARRGSFWMARVENSDTPESPGLTDANGLVTGILAARDQGISVISFENPERFPLQDELKQLVRHEFPNAERLWQAWLAASLETRRRRMSQPPQPIYLKPPHITPAKRSWLR
jgi:tRNA threonylcarbamoyladenosine biosynthesis protein TsaB